MMIYVCVLSTENYLEGLLVLNENLKFINSKYKLLCLINEEISGKTREILSYFNIQYKVMDKIDFNNCNDENRNWMYTFDKLNIFNLTEYEKIVYLDLDFLILKNLDHLFKKDHLSMPEDLPFNKNYYNSGIMVVKPNKDDFIKLKELANNANKAGRKISDQDIINEYFDNIKKLPCNYNMVRRIINYKNNFYDDSLNKFDLKYTYQDYLTEKKDPIIIHYIGVTKPFMLDALYNDEYSYLYFYFLETIRKKLNFFNICNNEKKISVIVPIYNSEKTLKKCIESILNQDYSNLEVILINDNSTDNSLKICDDYSKKDERIIVINNSKNMGVSKSRNIGLNVSSGEYVAFVDSDDYIEYNLYSELCYLIEKYNLDFAQSGIYMNDETSRETVENITWYSDKNQIISSFFNCDFISSVVWDKLYKKELISDIKFIEEYKKNEDIFYIFEVVKNSNRCAITQKKLYHYMFKSNVPSNIKDFNYEVDCNLDVYLDNIEKEIYQNYNSLYVQFTNYKFYINIYMINCIINNIKNENIDLIKIKIEKLNNYIKNINIEYIQYFDNFDFIAYNNLKNLIFELEKIINN